MDRSTKPAAISSCNQAMRRVIRAQKSNLKQRQQTNSSGTGNNTVDTKMVIDASGNVGIGIGAGVPSEKFFVNGRSQFSGNVGIGTATPHASIPLNVRGGTSQALFYEDGSGAEINLRDSNTSNDLQLGIRATMNDLGLVSGMTEHVRISSTGNIGVGTTTPNAKLHLFSTKNRKI